MIGFVSRRHISDTVEGMRRTGKMLHEWIEKNKLKNIYEKG